MASEIIRFLITAVASSLCFIGCGGIRGYGSLTMMPHIVHRNPWLINAASALYVINFIALPLNGWLIWGWICALLLPFFWFVVSNPIIGATVYRLGRFSDLISIPLIQLALGLLALLGITIGNIILR